MKIYQVIKSGYPYVDFDVMYASTNQLHATAALESIESWDRRCSIHIEEIEVDDSKNLNYIYLVKYDKNLKKIREESFLDIPYFEKKLEDKILKNGGFQCSSKISLQDAQNKANKIIAERENDKKKREKNKKEKIEKEKEKNKNPASNVLDFIEF